MTALLHQPYSQWAQLQQSGVTKIPLGAWLPQTCFLLEGVTHLPVENPPLPHLRMRGHFTPVLLFSILHCHMTHGSLHLVCYYAASVHLCLLGPFLYSIDLSLGLQVLMRSPFQSSALGMSTSGRAVLGDGGRHCPCHPGLEALGWLIYPRPGSLSSQNSNHASCIISIL